MGKIIFSSNSIMRKSEVELLNDYKKRIEYLEDLLSVQMSVSDGVLSIQSNSSVVYDECIHLLNVFNEEEVIECLK
jgi:hypothetical protein